MLGGEIKVLLTLDNGQFSIQTEKSGQIIQELKRSIDQTSKSTQALEGHFTGLHGRFRATVQTASMLRYALHDIHDIFMALPGAILKSSGEIERLTKLMQGMSKETTDAARKAEALSNVKFIFDMAQNAPFDVKTLTDSFVKLKSGGIDPTNGSMKGLMDSVAKFGGNSDTIHRASIAIQQMAGKGVISMEELRQQLGEAVPNAINMMADGAGMSVQKFAKLVQTGTVEASTSLRNMFAIMQIENKGASEAMMDTWSGMLALLNTKFELFKNEAGQAGLFDESKKALQEMIDAFDTMGAKSLAYDIGHTLGQGVVALRDLIGFFKEYGETIKNVGEVFLIYFGAQKLMELGNGIKSLAKERISIYEAEMVKARDATAKKADLIATEATLLRAKASQEETHAARSTQLAGQLYAQQAQYVNQVADLERRNLGWAGQQKIDRLNERIAETRATIVDIQTEAVARRNQAAEMHKVADAKERISAATRAGMTVSREDITIVSQTNEHAKKTVGLLNEKTTAAGRAAGGVGLMGKAMAGTQAVFAAFGGWVGIAITTLAFLADKLFEFLNRWKEAEEIQKRIKAGAAGEKDPVVLSARLVENYRTIADLERAMQQPRPEMGSVNPNSSRGQAIASEQALWDQRKTMLEKALEDRKGLIASINDAGNQIEKNSADMEVNAYKRKITADVTAAFREGNEKVRALEKKITDKQEELLKSNPNANTVDYERVGKNEREQIRQIRIELARGQVDFLRGEESKLNDELAKATNPEAQNKIKAKLTALTEERKGLIDGAKKLAEDMEKTGSVRTVKKPEADKPIDPFLRYVESLENDLAQAEQRLRANVKGVRGLAEMRNEAVIKVLGDMAEGRFDSNAGKDGDDVQRKKYIGGLAERQGFVKKFIADLNAGKGDVVEFVNSLKGLDDASRKLTLRAIEAATGQSMQKEQAKALTDAQQFAARAHDDLNAATVRYMSDGLAKEDAGMVALKKHFDALAEKIKGGTKDFEAFNAAKLQAIQDTVVAGNMNYSADQGDAIRKAAAAQAKATMTVTEAREFEYQQELRRIDAEQKARETATQKAMATGALDQFEFQAEMTRISVAGNNARKAASTNLAVANRTALDDLARGWRDTAQQMHQATASWSQGFLDNLANAISGGKDQWKQFVAGMAKDLLNMLLKKNLGDAITGMFGSFGSKMSDMLGLGGAAKTATDAADKTAQTSAVTTAMTTMTTETTSAMTGLTTGASVIPTAMTTATTAISTAMTSMVAAVQAGMSQMAAAASGSSGGGFVGSIFGGSGADGGTELSQFDYASVSGFASGGIMTSLGELSLKKYANGGIANQPQVALFGEGSMNEAYVPLPDGRTIPVTVTGGATTNQGGVQINIVVNKDGSASEASQGDEVDNWKRMAQRVRGVVMEEMVNQQRPGGVLYK